jgi:hypothetical protein
MRRSATLAIALGAFLALVGAGGTARGQEFTFSVDVPTDLQGTLFMSTQTIDYSPVGSPNYVLQFNGSGIEEHASVDALTLLPDGDFLFSTDATFTDGVAEYSPSDVVHYDGATGTFSLYLSGLALGMSETANIDALGFDATGRLTLSLSAPENIGGTDFEFNDIAVVDNGTLAVLLSGVALGFQPDLNVTGYDHAADGTDLFVFEIPVTLGLVDFTRSDIARHDAGTWSVLFHDPAFPPDSASRDFSLPCVWPRFPGTLFVGKPGGATEVSWTTGAIGLFDLVRGDLGELRSTGGDFTAALDAIAPVGDVCMADDTLFSAIVDLKADPASGEAYFYILRPVAGCRAGGTYDSGGSGQVGLRDAGIAASVGDCP